MDTDTRNALSWLPAMLILTSTLFVAALHVMPKEEGAPLGVVFKPGTTFAEAAYHVTEAGGDVLAPGTAGNILIVRIEDHDFPRLKAAGVWFSFSASATGLCSPAATNTGSSFPPGISELGAVL